ncbi:Peptidyl-prolyl cis-trans isomerase FKBP16-4 [Carex littledalei]|uniref:peptidylprolyl isomerase n=1 Tax=Carex littledalei TaxID=544730 RepID=A0A833VIS4_9POAL|nr:Peptidyl-prolyl cis-trans isomerase FKBP16-4 [Carex littledalei]
MYTNFHDGNRNTRAKLSFGLTGLKSPAQICSHYLDTYSCKVAPCKSSAYPSKTIKLFITPSNHVLAISHVTFMLFSVEFKQQPFLTREKPSILGAIAPTFQSLLLMEGDGSLVFSLLLLKASKIPESEFKTLPSGLKYYDIMVGGGAKAVKGSRVAIHYVAKWKGITFMTSRQGLGVGGGTPYGFDVGQSERGNVLKGLDLGVEGMKVGGQRILIVPPELAYGSRGVQEIPPNATIELDVELLSIKQTPFGETDSYVDLIQEEEEEDENNQQKMDSLIPVSQTEFVTPNVVRIEEVEEEPSLREEIEILNDRLSDVEERENQRELEFTEYCNMKNYESLVEKLQIMCLGLKIEYLEEQNQRLEESIAKLMEEKEKFEAMSGEIKRLKRNFEKISKRNEENMLMVHQKMQDYETREAELLRRNQELEMTIRDVKDMIQIKEKCTSKMEELTIEQGNATSLTQNKEMSNQIDRIRAEWAADMEEMIYIGWITTCLRHELSTTNKFEERKHEHEPKPKLEQNVLSIAFEPTSLVPLSDTKEREEEIMEVPVRSDEAQVGNEVIQSEPLVECANSITDPEENCMDAMVRKGSSKNLAKPKLMHKLKGWAKGNGKCRRS